MNIYILDPNTLEIIGLIDSYKSIIWTTRYFTRGDFEFKTPVTQKYIEVLQKDNFVVREQDITRDGYKNVMVIQSVSVATNINDGNFITVTGKCLKSILSRRIIWQQTTMNGKVEIAIRQIITDNVISPNDVNRRIDNFELNEIQGFEETVEIQSIGDDIAEWLETTCTTNGIGWDISIKDSKFVFELYKGVDRSYGQNINPYVVFSPEFDNLLSSTYTEAKAEYSNAALIGGEGEGVEQRTSNIGDSKGLQRFETYIDGSSVSSNGEIITEAQYYKMLEDYGKEQLTGTAFTKTYDGEVVADGNFKLNEDFYLGDIVQVVNEYGIESSPRITEIIDSEDENGRTIIPTFGTWEV